MSAVAPYKATSCGRWHYSGSCPSCTKPTTRQRKGENRLCRSCSGKARRGIAQPRSPRWWTRERIEAAMLDSLMRHGRWPTTHDWARATLDHPTQKTVYDRFGSWNAAKVAAGWSGSEVAP